MKYRVFESENYKQLQDNYQFPSLLAKIIDQKGYDDEQIKDMFQSRIIYHDFSLFIEAEMALERINEAILNEEKICIYGDYDCDGILATTILVQAFLKKGVHVGYHIPHRYEDGYGLNVKRVEQMAQRGYSLIITVDNGIKAFEAIEKANELGIDVIITDHHEFEEDVPDAFAIIHTKLSPDYPFKDISGGFVAYKLASALLGRQDKYLYTLAAITTVSDMMPLLDENRSLLKKGLEFMREEKYPALELLLGDKQQYDTTSIGYIIAPKINSFGRLPEMVHPNHLVKYFLENAPREYMVKIADSANKINTKRQSLTNQQYTIALKEKDDSFLYYGSHQLHEGIVGLIAGKYTREYELPSFVMHYDEEKKIYKGSARSVEGFSLHDFFSSHEQYLLTWGGHSQAGGFSLTQNHYLLFKEEIRKALMDCQLENYLDVLLIDNYDISISQIESMSLLEPFGMKNESPLFLLKHVPIDRIYTLSEGKHLKMDIVFPNIKMNALAFFKGDKIEELKDFKYLDLVGTLAINEFRNMKTIQFMIKDINPVL